MKNLRKKSALRSWMDCLLLGGLIFAGRSSLADHYHVPTGSMEPSVQVGDNVLVNKLAYGLKIPFTKTYLVNFNEPTLGDVVVVDSPEDEKILLKRVVGLPGQVIAVHDGAVFIDGKQSSLDFESETLVETIGDKTHSLSFEFGGGDDWGPMKIPRDKVLLMGDNRGNSHDGRHFGLVAPNTIWGKAERVVWRKGPSWADL